ncbi:MAG: phosphate ABC transporter substrate-binding protein PstS [Actinomycetota bacterium]|nr:phosphate ABC transporter substrate-binding protein PstS [Actinomycetota bacterium]MDQ3575911.1 phosphate ABC transporter substrate-binding protein PstS [Actinomycetota bacterium]
MTPRSVLRSTRVLTAVLAVSLLGAACGESEEEGGGSGGQSGEPKLTATLNGSGATFPQPFYEAVIAEFKEEQPGVTVNYGGGGSGKGRQELQDQVVDFAGSDGTVKAEDVPKYKGGEFLYVPTVAAPITVSYNLADVPGLKLDGPTIAKIFQREVKQWDDAAIKAMNPAAKLPATPITVGHRSDGSGTTENFTKYLTAAAPGVWKLGSGSTVPWPTDTQAGNGNSGVAQIVKNTPGAVGYVDLSDAKASQLQFAQVKNKAGTFVIPTPEGASAALEGAELKPDLTYNPLNASGANAYPITAPTWILVYKNQTDKTKAEALKVFLRYLLSDGQKLAAGVDYAELPPPVKDKALAQLDNLVVPA